MDGVFVRGWDHVGYGRGEEITVDPVMTASDLFVHRLNVMLTMERDAGLLATACADAAPAEVETEMMRGRARASVGRTRALEEVFELTGLKTEAVDSPTARVLVDEATTLFDATGPELREDVALATMLSMESLVTAGYDALAITARALGASDLSVRIDDSLTHARHMVEALRDQLDAAIDRRRPVA